eukprot:TRINITY_DN1571_c0_g5_i3.p1 TRINITY_DN1571_c0_g5~~TRINITY_DN1571_c0_g5_i3.p1  ORF type:complete len:504 (-),score=15.34 TRINITY_DN1571_c0_g5_i3:181-1692(-)
MTADGYQPTKKMTTNRLFATPHGIAALLLVFISTARLTAQATAHFSDGSWLEALQPPDWHVTHDFMGIPSASLYYHERYFACFLVLWKVCHVNYASDLFFNNPGAWYSTLGHNLTRLVSSGKLCRITDPTLKSSPHMKTIQLRGGVFLTKEAVKPYLAAEGKQFGISLTDTWDAVTHTEKAIVGNHDPHPGHMVEDFVVLADFQHSIWESLGRPKDFDLLYGNSLAYYWAQAEPKGHNTHSARVLRSVFGRKLEFLYGRLKQNHRCFDEVVFPTANSHFTELSESIIRFKERIYKLVKKEQDVSSLAYQITWLWRTKRRRVRNSGEVLEYLIDAFHDFPVKGMRMPIKVVEVNGHMPFEEMVVMMRKTAFAIGMHGAAMFQETYMQVGSHALEFVPYKLSSINFSRSAARLGVKHTVWLDTHFETTLYDNNCFTNSSWHDLPDDACKNRCWLCTKNHPLTQVAVSEIRPIIEALKPSLREWLLERQPKLQIIKMVNVIDEEGW